MKLHAQIARLLATPDAQESFAANGSEPGGEPPEQFAAYIRAEHAKRGRGVREAGIKIQ